MFLKKSIEQIQPYRLVSQEAWSREDALKLDWNESTIPISEHVKQSLINAISTIKFNWYPNVNNKRLTELLAEYSDVEQNQVLYFASSDSAQEYIGRTFLNESDNVLIIAPTYDNFRVTCQSESYNIFFHFLDESLNLNLDKLKIDISELNPKLVYISNPNNPTGTEYKQDTIEFLLKNFPNTLFMIDEAYIEFGETIKSSAPLIKKYNNIIITRTFSKAFGLAGFRIGYTIGNKDLLANISKIRNSKAVTSLSQVVAIAALEDIQYMYNYVKDVKTAKKYFISELEKLGIPYKAQGGNFVLIKPNQPKELIEYLKGKNIFIRDYTHVKELNGYNTRITIGTINQMELVVQTIKQYLNEYNKR